MYDRAEYTNGEWSLCVNKYITYDMEEAYQDNRMKIIGLQTLRGSYMILACGLVLVTRTRNSSPSVLGMSSQ